MSKFRMLTAVVMTMVLSSAMAAEGGFDNQKLYLGAGLSSNSLSGTDSSIGWQVLGGYEIAEVVKNIFVDAEVGYMDTGNMDVNCPIINCGSTRARGLWATGVGRVLASPQVELLARFGYDFGDDDGFMGGIGAGYILNKQTKLRVEFVERDHVDSVQFNVVFKLQ